MEGNHGRHWGSCLIGHRQRNQALCGWIVQGHHQIVMNLLKECFFKWTMEGERSFDFSYGIVTGFARRFSQTSSFWYFTIMRLWS